MVRAAPATRERSRRADGYERHRPELTVLYRLVEQHWPGFRERVEDVGALPEFVVREFDEYLRCGILEHGFLELVCRRCGHSELVAFPVSIAASARVA